MGHERNPDGRLRAFDPPAYEKHDALASDLNWLCHSFAVNVTMLLAPHGRQNYRCRHLNWISLAVCTVAILVLGPCSTLAMFTVPITTSRGCAHILSNSGYSSVDRFAAHIANTRCVTVGTGFHRLAEFLNGLRTVSVNWLVCHDKSPGEFVDKATHFY